MTSAGGTYNGQQANWFASAADPAGQTIWVDYVADAASSAVMQVCMPWGGAGIQNMCMVDSQANEITFGATQPNINFDYTSAGIASCNYSYTPMAQFLGQVNTQFNTLNDQPINGKVPPAPLQGGEYIVNIAAGFVGAVGQGNNFTDFDPSWNAVKTVDNGPFVADFDGPDKNVTTGFLNAMCVPTPEQVTVQQVTPYVGAVSYSGPTIVTRYAITDSRTIGVFRGTIHIKKIFYSN